MNEYTREKKRWSTSGPLAWLRDRIGVMKSWGPVAATYTKGETVTSKGGGCCMSSPEVIRIYWRNRLVAAVSSFNSESLAVSHWRDGSKTVTCSVRENMSIPVSFTYHDDPAYPSQVNLWVSEHYTPGGWPVVRVIDVSRFKIVVTHAAKTREYLRAKHGPTPTLYEELCEIVRQKAADARN